MPRAARLLIVAVALALTFAGLGVASSTVAADVGHITGTVTGPDGQPLEGVSVHAMSSSSQNADGDYTDENGNYELSYLADGAYRLEASSSSGLWLTEYWNDAADYESATDVVLSGGETVTGKNFQLAPAGHITGTVTDAAGQPLQDVFVHAIAYSNELGRWNEADPVDTAETDAAGHYDLGGLRTGTYRVQFESTINYIGEFWNNAATVGAASDIAVTAGEAVTKNAQLAHGGRISGRVTNSAGQGIAGVQVVPFADVPSAGGWTSENDWETSTDANGDYQLDTFGMVTASGPADIRLLFNPGSGHVSGGPSADYLRGWWGGGSGFDDAPTFSLTAEGNVTGKDIQLVKGGHITGTVTGPDGQPLSDVVVTLYAIDVETHDWDSLDDDYTYEDGTYDFRRLEAGAYRVGYEDQSGHNYYAEFWNNAASLNAATDISMAVGSTVTLVNARLDTSAPGPTSEPSPTQSPSPSTTPTPTPTTTPTKPTKITAIVKPKLKGKAKYGATLKVATGTWSPSKAKVQIRWLAGGKPIAKQTAAKLKLTGKVAKAVAGKAIRVQLRVTAAGYTTLTTVLKVPGKVKLPKKH
jgi:protocatechuate 3,4-dioxygenase beta subunit